jgi:hypothetical protein
MLTGTADIDSSQCLQNVLAAAAKTVSKPLIKPDREIAPFALNAAMANHAALLLSNEEGLDLPDSKYYLQPTRPAKKRQVKSRKKL